LGRNWLAVTTFELPKLWQLDQPFDAFGSLQV